MIQINWQKIKNKIIRFVLLQLFITCVSLPILLWWGLPISAVSPISSIFFGPILTAFLLIASLLFFTELFGIPNALFVFALEKITQFWQMLIATGTNSFLFALPKPPLWMALLMPFCAFFIIQFRHTHPPKRSTLALGLLLFFMCFSLKKLYCQKEHHIEFACHGKTVHVFQTESKTIVIDHGVMGRRISAPSWVQYTFLPEVIKKLGTITIDHLIVLQPSCLTFQAIATMASKTTVKNVHLVLWKNTLPKNAWREFFLMKEKLSECNTTLHRIGFKQQRIQLDSSNYIKIIPLENQLRYHEAKFPALQIDTHINNQTVTLYSAKLKR